MRRYDTRRMLPPDLKVDIERFREDVIDDQGGLDELSAVRGGHIRLLVDCEALRRLSMNALLTAGTIESPAGRRAADRLLATVDRWLRVAEKLGLDRRARQLDPLEAVRVAVERANSEEPEP
jgi:hypothetical protein